ncbi:type II toxin-antitoxin system RelB/DinJ family antitoxin [Lentilactobacillus hilgardii]|uniref:Type II toxin-antitoxin system RelB/DinJ family antitoxin n=1 Tax=Lentilactobacillus hilgardii TaxID=1588 RepID=A0A6P1E438_LENHI|nr:type II toxin-antitoxin system RelB/DinJ family antitoxin [Lentilactobacillus hilgardii]EEI71728.1 addiction module antitoxin, RelB/DinJ family [Lentilactobacillus hilgardii ATCC 27305]MCT3390884.1 type II toxin-antitoxin system RelB/DinJ family antitoxin [Lentilactobacillus hilgardii]QHB51428.1 type II toxin-antitoxin system RelB/DinJ family antitoxin [Lentilactobacillus hilgardii]RRG07138.1 MAG: type II toxin-antitoxin system RelB/DinJ family antitoxin [Lactobacillus sp.]
MKDKAVEHDKNDKLIQVRIDKSVAAQAEDIFNRIGVTPTTAINAFYRKVISTGGIPFNLTISQDDKDALEIRQLAKKIPVERLDTDEKIKKWFDDPRYDY